MFTTIALYDRNGVLDLQDALWDFVHTAKVDKNDNAGEDMLSPYLYKSPIICTVWNGVLKVVQ